MAARFTAPPAPSVDPHIFDRVCFLHPGYDGPKNVIFSHPRVDKTAATPPAYGVHHRTALVACQIIADNAFTNGYFSHDKAGLHRVSEPLDGILSERQYYFVVNDSQDPYPIVPSFQDWSFPHDNIPAPWLQTSLDFPAPTGRCGITNFSNFVEGAHLVPEDEAHWYSRNDMDIYGKIIGDINESSNILSLRADIHRAFDKRSLVIVPKVPGPANLSESETSSSSNQSQFVTHVLSAEASEYWSLFHNSSVQNLDSNSRPYLFARFAWAVLLFVKPFVTSGYRRHVTRLQILQDDNGDTRFQRKSEFLGGLQLSNQYSGGGSRGATPKKRRFEMDDSENRETSNAWDDVIDNWGARGLGTQQVSSESVSDAMPEDETIQSNKTISSVFQNVY